MIDIHCHILPGLDDGARTMEEALAMARIAAADGIDTLVASSHITPGVYDNPPERIAAAAEAFGERLVEEGIPIRIIPGADVRMTPELLDGDGRCLCINRDTPYFLFEFPHDLVPPGSERLVEALRGRGRVPVITHPERNTELQRRPEKLEPFVRMGCLVQITAMSLTGGFGSRAQAAAERFLKEGRAHLIATDAHNTITRPPILSRAVRRAEALVGAAAARAMVFETPEKMVRGLRVEV
ncbi:MAG TPA: CpsB/CapC family capsule biosynthesis tyrosine phosphatase [Nitrospiria bacterium]|nr:CpsB/CapC family capsule biosynthesis tyrosine phosphatase [Nitrospiria bacterium]